MEINTKNAEIVQAIKRGDTKSFELLYDNYSSSLYGLILKIVKDEGLAQDVLQDCFVNIWKKISSFDETKGSLFTWMMNICRNKSIDSLRGIKRKSEGNENYRYENESIVNGGYATNIDKIGLKDIIEKLPEEQQIIIDFIYFRGYTQQEVADELNIPLGTVKTRTRSALIGLRENFTLILTLWILKNI